MAPPTGKSKHFVEWEEEYVSNDRGSRVVHYYLKDRHENRRLAVVGTEKSLRHMVYVVSNEFLYLLGNSKSISPSSSTNSSSCSSGSMKWRSRREVVDWLCSLLSRTRSAASAGEHRESLQKTWLCLCCREYCLVQSTKKIIWTNLISNPALRKLWSDREYLVLIMEVDT